MSVHVILGKRYWRIYLAYWKALTSVWVSAGAVVYLVHVYMYG